MIRIQNIYHMLTYAFQTLQGQGYRGIAAEEFDNTADLLAEILSRGVSLQLKRGLGREYVDRKEMLSSPRGKIELSESLKTRSILRRQLVCSYDEFSTDTRMNRILKATIMLLIRSDIDKARKKALRRLLPYFVDVEDVSLSGEDWHMRFDRNQPDLSHAHERVLAGREGPSPDAGERGSPHDGLPRRAANEPPVREVHPRVLQT